MTRREFLASAALMAAAGSCGGIGSHQIRFKLSVRVFVDGVESTGESVNQIRWRPGSGLGPVHTEPYIPKYWAEAPTIDLGEHGLLFALLKPPISGGIELAFNISRSSRYLLRRLPAEQQRIEDIGRQYALLRQLEGEFDLRPQELPVLLRFRDVADAATAEVVEHSALASIYGPGARFLGGSISITGAPLTHVIATRLPWLRQIREQSGENLLGSNSYGGPRAPVARRLLRKHFELTGFEA